MKVYICVISSMEYNKEYNTIEPVYVESSSQACQAGSKKNAPKLVHPSFLDALSTESMRPSFLDALSTELMCPFSSFAQ
jgi:hypothetical protein